MKIKASALAVTSGVGCYFTGLVGVTRYCMVRCLRTVFEEMPHGCVDSHYLS